MRALLVIDMQVGCFSGNPPRRDEAGTVSRINALAQALRPQGLVVFIQHTDADEGYPRGTPPWQLLPALLQEAGDLTVEKTACDAFLETELHTILQHRGVDELYLAGCATDFCVDTTVRAAAALGYRVTVASDAHTTRDRPHLPADKLIEHHNYLWRDLLLPRKQTVRVLSTRQILAEWAAAAPSV